MSGADEANLIGPTQNAIHSAAVKWVFAKRTLNQDAVSDVVLHLMQAECFNDATELYACSFG